MNSRPPLLRQDRRAGGGFIFLTNYMIGRFSPRGISGASVAVEAGVNFLEPWQGVAAGDFAVFGQEGESLLSESAVEQFYNFGQSTFAVNQVFYCIFQQKAESCGLFRVYELFGISKINLLFAKSKSVCFGNFCFQVFVFRVFGRMFSVRASVSAGSIGDGFCHNTSAVRHFKCRSRNRRQRILPA